MIKVTATFLIDDTAIGVREGESPARIAAGIVAEYLAGYGRHFGTRDRLATLIATPVPASYADDLLRAMTILRDGEAEVAVDRDGDPWRETVPNPGADDPAYLADLASVEIVGCILPDPDPTPARTAPVARLVGYSDRACAQCRNALTYGEAEDGERLCATCQRDRRYLYAALVERAQSLADGTASLVDPETNSIIELSARGQDEQNSFTTIRRIHVPAEHRGKGIASTLLAMVCVGADECGDDLLLECAARDGAGGLDDDALLAWYARHGFVRDPDAPQHATGRARWLVRRPHAAMDIP